MLRLRPRAKTMRPKRRPLPAKILGLTKILRSHSVVGHWYKEIDTPSIFPELSMVSSPVVLLACQARVFASFSYSG